MKPTYYVTLPNGRTLRAEVFANCTMVEADFKGDRRRGIYHQEIIHAVLQKRAMPFGAWKWRAVKP